MTDSLSTSISDRAYEIIKELSTQKDISEVLEIGCWDGSFVELLRLYRYNAYGIDIQDKLGKKGVDGGYLRQCNAISMDEKLFGSMSFDLILANRIMCRNTVASLISERYFEPILDGLKKTPSLKTMLGIQGFAGNITQQQNELILKASFKKLKPGKYFVAVESDSEQFGFNEQDAQKIGYTVIRYKPNEAIFQKPE